MAAAGVTSQVVPPTVTKSLFTLSADASSLSFSVNFTMACWFTNEASVAVTLLPATVAVTVAVA